jgi:hypothetical protein
MAACFRAANYKELYVDTLSRHVLGHADDVLSVSCEGVEPYGGNVKDPHTSSRSFSRPANSAAASA